MTAPTIRRAGDAIRHPAFVALVAPPRQPQRVGDDDQRRQRHARGGDQWCHEAERRRRDGDGVVGGRPREVLADHRQRAARLAQSPSPRVRSRSERITTSAVCCASGVAVPRLIDTCACASAGASLIPSPSIATTAPRACSRAMASRLSVRREVAVRIRNAQRRGHRVDAGLTVAGQHERHDPQLAQFADQARRVRTQRVREREERKPTLLIAQRGQRAAMRAVVGQRAQPGGHGPRQRGDIIRSGRRGRAAPATRALDALARCLPDIAYHGRRMRFGRCVGGVAQRVRQWMFRARVDRRRKGDRLRPRNGTQRRAARQPDAPSGQRARSCRRRCASRAPAFRAHRFAPARHPNARANRPRPRARREWPGQRAGARNDEQRHRDG